jgi:hypothetical protein
MNKILNRHHFTGAVKMIFLWLAVSGYSSAYGEETASPASSGIQAGKDTLWISTFDIDATPPVGSDLTYNRMTGVYDLGLRAKGVVLTGAGLPVVLCAIDWIGISNESQDVFKQVLAGAAHTLPERVLVHVVHQHDAPICDFSAEKILREAGLDPGPYDGTYAREFIIRLGKAVGESLGRQKPVTHLGIGKANVYEVASNRRILGDDGKVVATRYTSCPDPELRAQPEGLIDPELTLLSFWNQDTPLAVMTFYAVHPQSYYRTGIACPDFPGIARFYRQLAVPDALHIHFNGAGGNLGAGKYNDGSHEMRLELAKRLADGMERAWKSVEKTPLSPKEAGWEAIPVALPVSATDDELEKRIAASKEEIKDNISEIVWSKRQQAGKNIDITCLRLGKARILFMPGELFVEYQLAAKALRPDLSVSMAAYGEGGPAYIGTRESYLQGGYEVESSPVTADSEEILMDAVRKLLKK